MDAVAASALVVAGFGAQMGRVTGNNTLMNACLGIF